MSFNDWANAKMQLMQWHDISFVKLSSFAFALMVAKLWQPILSLEWYWYLIISILAAAKPVYVVWIKNN